MPARRGERQRAELRGWRVRVFVELQAYGKWQTEPAKGPGFTWSGARRRAQAHANAGRRARLVDPDGIESSDVPIAELDESPGPLWRRAM